MRLRAVVFDYGGVLNAYQPPDALARLERLAGVAGDQLWSAYWALRVPYDRGEYDGPAYWREVGAQLGRTWPPEVVARLIEEDAAGWLALNPPVVRWALALGPAGVRTGLLSNAPRELAVRLVDEFAWLRGFDHLTFSCDLGLAKPAHAIYRHCLDGLGVPAAETLFVDDRGVNVDAAAELGMRTILFTSVAAFAFELSRLDGLPPFEPGPSPREPYQPHPPSDPP